MHLHTLRSKTVRCWLISFVQVRVLRRYSLSREKPFVWRGRPPFFKLDAHLDSRRLTRAIEYGFESMDTFRLRPLSRPRTGKRGRKSRIIILSRRKRCWVILLLRLVLNVCGVRLWRPFLPQPVPPEESRVQGEEGHRHGQEWEVWRGGRYGGGCYHSRK